MTALRTSARPLLSSASRSAMPASARHLQPPFISTPQARHTSVWTRVSRAIGLSPSAELQQQRDDVASGRKGAAGPAPDGVQAASSNTTPSQAEMQTELRPDQRAPSAAGSASSGSSASAANKGAAATDNFAVAQAAPQRKESIAERDARLHRLFLDRDGGEATVGIVNGEWEGGMGPMTKSQMFRVI